MKRKLLSVFLALCMTLTLVPAASAGWIGTGNDEEAPNGAKIKVEYYGSDGSAVTHTRYFDNKDNDDFPTENRDHIWDPVALMSVNDTTTGEGNLNPYSKKAVITLLDDITLEDTTILVDQGKNVTINGGGHKITCTLSGTIAAGEGGAHNPGMDAISIASDNTSNALTLDNVNMEITGPESSTNATQGIYNDGTLTLQNGATVSVSSVSQNGINGSGTLSVKGGGTKLDVQNVKGSAIKNGSISVAEQASVTVQNVTCHGLTAGSIAIDNATVTVTDAGYYGIISTSKEIALSNQANVSVTGSAENNYYALKSTGKLTVENSKLSLADNTSAQVEAPSGTNSQSNSYDTAIASNGATITGSTLTGELLVTGGDADIATSTIAGDVSNTGTGSTMVAASTVTGSVSNASTGTLALVGATVGSVVNAEGASCVIIGSTVDGQKVEDDLSGLDAKEDNALIAALNWKNKFPDLLGSDAGKTNLLWKHIINATHWLDIAGEKDNSSDAGKKAIYDTVLKDIKTYYASIPALDLSGKQIGDSGFPGANTGCLVIFTGLTALNLSDTGITEIGGLSDMKSLEALDLSNNANLADTEESKVLGALATLTALKSLDLSNCSKISNLGGLTTLTALTTLDISDTAITDFNFMWSDEGGGAPRYTSLTSLTARNLDNLTSITGLVNVATADGFSAKGIVWDLSGSKIKEASGALSKIKEAFGETGSFYAPNDPVYTITLNPNGGTVGTTNLVTRSDGTLETLPTPTRSGTYSFDGWYTTQNGGDKVTVDYKFTGNTMIYAHWTYTGSSSSGGGGGGAAVTTYTLTFDTNGGTAIAKVTKNKGTTINLSDYTTTREGYTFAGWYADEGLTDKVTSITLNANKTVYAKWTENVPVEPEPTVPFTDVKEGDWFYDAVCYVYANDMMNGVSENSFAPNGTTSRAMLVTILYRLEKEPAVSGSSFTDVPSGQWYSNAVAWAAENGIVNGVTATTFAPNSAITREQMAAILYRYAAWKGSDVSERVDLSGYTDAASVSGYATEAMAWANAEGLITGVTNTTLRPAGSAVRAQAATILMRLCENVLA